MRRRTAGVLAALTVTAGVTLSAAPAEAASPLQFGKINYNAPGTDTSSNTSVNGEYVVIKNVTGTKRCLTNWTVRDAAGYKYTFGSFCLAAYKYVYLHTGKGTNTTTRRYWGRSWHVWNNTGDTAYLRNGSGTLMDRCSWSGGGTYVNC